MDRQQLPLRILGVIVVVLALASGVQGYTQGRTNTRLNQDTQRLAEQNQRTTDCLKRYADATADALDARTAAANTAADALDDLFEAFLLATPDPAGREQARLLFKDYVTKRKAARQAQTEHPYPPPPRNLC